MPYKRQRKNTSMVVAKKALRLAKQNAPEKKYHDAHKTSTNVSLTGALQLDMTAIPQGDDHNDRNGDSIKLQRLHINYRMYGNTANNSSSIRLIVIRMLEQQAGTLPSVSNVLDTTAPTWLANYNDDNHNPNFKTFKVLHDKSYIFGIAGYNGWSKTGVLDIPLYGAKAEYYSTASGAIRNGGLYVMAISDQAVSYPTIELASRLTYTDP